MTAVRFASFLAPGRGAPIPIGDWSGRLSDVDYITGSIELVVGRTLMMKRTELDLVDQLWMYLLMMTEEVLSGGRAEMYYPDQPIEISLECARPGVLDFRIKVGPSDRRAVVPMADWAFALVRDGRVFWQRLSAIAPENLDAVNEARDIMDRIESRAPAMA